MGTRNRRTFPLRVERPHSSGPTPPLPLPPSLFVCRDIAVRGPVECCGRWVGGGDPGSRVDEGPVAGSKTKTPRVTQRERCRRGGYTMKSCVEKTLQSRDTRL